VTIGAAPEFPPQRDISRVKRTVAFGGSRPIEPNDWSATRRREMKRTCVAPNKQGRSARKGYELFERGRKQASGA
jgi:hypothetical protein